MTSLVHETPEKTRTGTDLADKIGIAIALVAAALAIGLAIVEIAGAPPADMPSLIPLDEGHYWSGFSA
jgi:hypothetical protein